MSADQASTGGDGRKLVAVVHADIAGYSRLVSRDDLGTAARIRTIRRELIDPTLRQHGGRVAQTAGDSLLMLFDSITEAVTAAVRLQREMPKWDGPHPAESSIRFRMGIEIGDVIADHGDFHGTGVNLAARLQGHSAPGGICVSRAVHDHVRDLLDLSFDDLGPVRFKNIARPVEAFAIRLDAEVSADGGSMRTAAASQPMSIVVLPFANLAGDAEGDYLAKALTDDLTHELAAIQGHHVVARTSAAAYRGRSLDLRQIGQVLNVRYAIEGSLRKIGVTLRVNVQLISTATAARIWGDRLEQSVKCVESGLQEIVLTLRGMLDVQILAAEQTQGARERGNSPTVYDMLVRAWSGWSKPPTPAHLREMTDLLERALGVEPSSVPVLCELAAWLTTRYTSFLGGADWGDEDLVQRAIVAVDTATALDPTGERVLHMRGSVMRVSGRWEEASAENARLLALYPNSSAGYRDQGRLHLLAGRLDEAITSLQTAIRLEPMSGTVWASSGLIGQCALLLGRDGEAIEWLARSLLHIPETYARARAYRHLYIASAHAFMGEAVAARKALGHALGLWPWATVRSVTPGFEPRGLPSSAYARTVERLREGLRLAGLREYADASLDSHAPSHGGLHVALDGRTPTSITGALTIRTDDLTALMNKPGLLLIDAALGSWGRSIPDAIGLQGAAGGAALSAALQDRFARVLMAMTNGRRDTPIVAFCVNCHRFSGYNLALRLVSLGYTNVSWYRGGLESWQAAGLADTPVTLRAW